jgi:uncharacterized protein YcfJ
MRTPIYLAGLMAASITVSNAAAGHRNVDNPVFTDQARVIKVKPIYREMRISQPETHCWDEEIHYDGNPRKSYTGVIAGGILGGVIGNQFGHDNGRDIMTVAGTLLGASIGHDISRRQTDDFRRVEDYCETYDSYTTREEIVGYRVKYRYQGNNYWTRTESDPGDYIRVSVNVRPINY